MCKNRKNTNFIFSVIASEWGFIGSVGLIIVYFLIELRILQMAKTSKNISGKVICVGVSATLLFSMFQNIGMTIGIMPVSGITLPL